MGYSILELVLRRLRQAGFRADVAFPGQQFPQIQDTVATVHIEKVDRANLTVTMGVSVITLPQAPETDTVPGKLPP